MKKHVCVHNQRSYGNAHAQSGQHRLQNEDAGLTRMYLFCVPNLVLIGESVS